MEITRVDQLKPEARKLIVQICVKAKLRKEKEQQKEKKLQVAGS